MKKIFSILLLAAVCFCGNMQAETLGPLYDGTNSAGSSIPVEGNNIDRYQKVQLIYPKADLAALAENNITKMTFYLKTKATKDWNAPIQIRLAETDADQFTTTSYLTSDSWTVVYTGTTLTAKGDQMEVTFDNSFAYSGEKNLLFELQVTGTSGSYSAATFYAKGGYDEYLSIYKYVTSGSSEGITSGTRKNALPKTLFTYEAGAPATCEKPTGLKEIEVAAKTATLAWDKVADASWQYICLPAADELNWTNATTTTDTFAIVNGLNPETNYKFYVRRYCSAEDQSKEVSIAFQTEKSCFAPTLLNVEESDVTTTTAKATWHASGKGEASYQYTYAVYGQSADWTNAPTTTDLNVTLTGLTSKTSYQIWVRSYCADDDQSEAATTYFSTLVDCSAKALPWSEDFENQEVSAAPDCWKLLGAYESGYTYPVISVKSNSGYYKDTKALLFRSNANVGYAIFPEIADALTNAEITFSHVEEDATKGGYLVLGYMTDITDDATFQQIFACTPSTSWVTEEPIALSAVPAGARLAFKYSGASYYYDAAVDNILIQQKPSCAIPTAFAVSEVTASSAKVAWESEAEKFALQLSNDGETFNDINGVITNPYVLNGLNEQTQYWVRVKAICSNDLESDWTEATTFTTPCATKAFGYTESFDGDELTACWENTDTHGMNEWSVYENAARYATTTNNMNHATLVSPWIAVEAEGNPVLLFDWQNTGATASLSIEAEGEAVALLQDLSEATTDWTLIKLYLTNYKGKNVRFLFYGESSAKSKYLYVDNFAVVEKPFLSPTDLKAEAIEGGANLTWKAGWDEPTWAIQVKATSAENWIPVNAAPVEPAYTLTGLDDETEYEVQVQAIYGENKLSEWTESAVFTTPAKTTPTAVENTAVKATATKRIVNGQLIIERNGEQYNAQGVSVK